MHQNTIQSKAVRVIACGALANELTALKEANNWAHLDIACLPAKLHHQPKNITPRVEQAIHQAREDGFEEILIGYGDCGTGGLLDALLEKEQVVRLPGSHCYEFFSTTPAFTEMAKAELGTFYLTDFLARHFDFFVWQMLGLDRKPKLRDIYFEHYTKVMYLAQTENQDLVNRAKAASEKLGLEYDYHFTGYGDLQTSLSQHINLDSLTTSTSAVNQLETDD